MATEQQTRLIERLVVERDLYDERVLSFTLEDGTVLSFEIKTLTVDDKNSIKHEFDRKFPAPPTITHNIPGIGKIARFDLEDEGYKRQLKEWQNALSRAVVASCLDVSPDDVNELERTLQPDQFTELMTTVELLNGGYGEPMADLIRDAMWAPEVLAWLETYRPEPDSIQITDTVLFREMEAMTSGGLTLREWDQLSPRERMTYLEWWSYKAAREAYQNWWQFNRPKETPGRRFRS